MTTEGIKQGQELQASIEALDTKIGKIEAIKAETTLADGHRLHFLISGQSTRNYEALLPDDLPAEDLLELALVRIRKRRLDLQTQFDHL